MSVIDDAKTSMCFTNAIVAYDYTRSPCASVAILSEAGICKSSKEDMRVLKEAIDVYSDDWNNIMDWLDD